MRPDKYNTIGTGTLLPFKPESQKSNKLLRLRLKKVFQLKNMSKSILPHSIKFFKSSHNFFPLLSNQRTHSKSFFILVKNLPFSFQPANSITFLIARKAFRYNRVYLVGFFCLPKRKILQKFKQRYSINYLKMNIIKIRI